ncbi:MAG: hypothetical protein KC425_13680, partial [Anaerolineales bacterium]|nr:hypothetical protein [Anaerolineales bacterium]
MTTTETAAYSGPVTELAIRILNDGQGVAAFAAARDAFITQLKAQPGVAADREFVALVDGATFAPPAGPVYTGMTEYANMAAFAAAGEALGSSAAAGAFFGTFTPAAFTALRPK